MYEQLAVFRSAWGGGPAFCGAGDELADGVAGGLFGEEGVAGADAGEDQIVVFDGFDPGIAGGVLRVYPNHSEGKYWHEDLSGLQSEESVTWEFTKLQVESKIRIHGAAEILLLGGLVHGFDGLFQAGQVRALLGQQPGGEALKYLPNLIGLGDVFAGQLRDPSAASWLFSYQTFGD